MFFSRSIRAVKSTGNPNVSYNSKAFEPEIVFDLLLDITSSSLIIPLSKVLKKESSSCLITFLIISIWESISGKTDEY